MVPSPIDLPTSFMREAIRLAMMGVQAGSGGPFGAVVVKDSQIVGRGFNRVTSTNDPTAHAEILAIRDACQRLGVFHLPGCEIYTTCQPCPMCLAAIYWARIDRYYFGCTAADAAASGFSDEFIGRQLALPLDLQSIAAVPLMREEALAVFAAWESKPDRVLY